MFWSAIYSASVLYTKTIIHLSVGKYGRYLPGKYPPLFTSTSVNYCYLMKTDIGFAVGKNTCNFTLFVTSYLSTQQI